MTEKNCDSCSGCPASAKPGTCEETSFETFDATTTVAGRTYRATKAPVLESCAGCVAYGDRDLCRNLVQQSESICNKQDLIFKVRAKRLEPVEIEDLKRRAIEQYGGTWLHHYAQLIEQEVLSRAGLL